MPPRARPHDGRPAPPPGIPCVTDCVMAELEKLGHRYRVALRCVPLPCPNARPPSDALTCTRPQSRARSAVRAADVLAPGHVRGRLPRPARDVAQVLRRRDVRPRAPPADTQDPRGAAHVHRPAAVCDRAAAGPGCARMRNMSTYVVASDVFSSCFRTC